MKLTLEAKYEINRIESEINKMAREVESYAIRIKEEMEEVVKMADHIKSSSKKVSHCQLEPSDLTAWRDLPRIITALDAKIKGLNTMKFVLREMGVDL